jgi:HEAT repeat protein
LAVPITLELLGDRSKEVVEAALEVLKGLPYGEGAWMSLSGEDQYIPFGDDVVEGNTIVHYDLVEYLAPIYEYLEQNLLPRQTLRTVLAAATAGPRLSRTISLFTMGAARHEAAIPILVSASITEEDDVVREIAVWSLSEISASRNDDPRIQNALLLASSDLIGNVRYRAALGLSRTAGDDAQKALSEMLNDRSPKIVKLAIEALGDIKNRAAFDALSRFLRSHRGSSEYVGDLLKAYAVNSISKQRGQNVEAVLLETLSQDRYASAFDARDRSGKYVAAVCLRELRSHATSASVPVVRRFASVNETVNVHTNLGQSSSYWPISISDSVEAVLKAVSEGAG